MDSPKGEREQEVLQLVTFHVGKEEFGVDILAVREINRMMAITRVPHAPEFVEGVINLRGQVIPVVDVRSRFGLAAAEHDKNTRIVVVELPGKVVGFLVDSVSEVLRVSAALVEPAPAIAGGIEPAPPKRSSGTQSSMILPGTPQRGTPSASRKLGPRASRRRWRIRRPFFLVVASVRP